MANTETITKVNELLAGHCYAPLREAAEKWLADANDDTNAELIKQLHEGICTVDELITTFGAEDAKDKFGDMAATIYSHALELKESGEGFCDCPACTKAKEILADLED